MTRQAWKADPSRLDRAIDELAWRRLLKLRSYLTDESGQLRSYRDRLAGVPPEALAEFPPRWVAAARAGAFTLQAGQVAI